MSNNVGLMKCEREEVEEIINGLRRGDTLSRRVNDGLSHHEHCTGIYFSSIYFFVCGKYKCDYESILPIHLLLLLLLSLFPLLSYTCRYGTAFLTKCL